MKRLTLTDRLRLRHEIRKRNDPAPGSIREQVLTLENELRGRGVRIEALYTGAGITDHGNIFQNDLCKLAVLSLEQSRLAGITQATAAAASTASTPPPRLPNARENTPRPGPAPLATNAAALSDEALADLAIEVFGTAALDGSETREALERQFFQAGLTLPGMDVAAESARHYRVAPTGVARATAAARQATIDSFCKQLKP